MAMVFLDPGRMNARLELEAPVETPDGQGGASLSFQPVTPLWAYIDPVSRVTGEVAGAERAVLTHRIWILSRGGIERGMRFRKGARLFAIRAVYDPDESGRYLICQCEEEGR